LLIALSGLAEHARDRWVDDRERVLAMNTDGNIEHKEP
jgi:hypothetical protein